MCSLYACNNISRPILLTIDAPCSALGPARGEHDGEPWREAPPRNVQVRGWSRSYPANTLRG